MSDKHNENLLDIESKLNKIYGVYKYADLKTCDQTDQCSVLLLYVSQLVVYTQLESIWKHANETVHVLSERDEIIDTINSIIELLDFTKCIDHSKIRVNYSTASLDTESTNIVFNEHYRVLKMLIDEKRSKLPYIIA